MIPISSQIFLEVSSVSLIASILFVMGFFTNLNISSVYRVIEFWVKLKVIHKISLLNKYMLCDNTDEKHTHITNICTSCLSVIETCNESMGLDLIESSKKLGVVLSPGINIEIPVICQKCQ